MTAHQSDATVAAVARSLAETFAKAAGWLDDMSPDARRALIGGGVGAAVGGLGGLVSGAGGAGAKKRPLHNFLLGAGLGAGVGGTAGYIGSRVLDPKPDRGVSKDLGGWTPQTVQKLHSSYQSLLQTGDTAAAARMAQAVFPGKSPEDAMAEFEKNFKGYSLNVDAKTPVNKALGTGYGWGADIVGSVLDKKVGLPTLMTMMAADAGLTLTRHPWLWRTTRSDPVIVEALKTLGGGDNPIHSSVVPDSVRKALRDARRSGAKTIELLSKPESLSAAVNPTGPEYLTVARDKFKRLLATADAQVRKEFRATKSKYNPRFAYVDVLSKLKADSSVTPAAAQKAFLDAVHSGADKFTLLSKPAVPGRAAEVVPAQYKTISTAAVEHQLQQARQKLIAESPGRGFGGFGTDGAKILQRRYLYPLGIAGMHLMSAAGDIDAESRREAAAAVRSIPMQPLKK